MLSLFTTCKPFEGDAAHTQWAAIWSWAVLPGPVEIILVGNEYGVADMAREVGARHIPTVTYTRWGAPDLADVFQRAKAVARYPYHCYVNADIVLFPSVLDATRRAGQTFKTFVMGGQRTNTEPLHGIGPLDDAFYDVIEDYCQRYGTLLAPTGLDYFIHPADTLRRLDPGLGIGHLAWDNYLPWIMRYHEHGVFVDCTPYVRAWHQDHPVKDMSTFPGAQANHAIVRKHGFLQLPDADYTLTPKGEFHARASD